MNRTILLLFAIALSACTVFAQQEVNRPLITVTGQAEIMVVPDEVNFSLRVVTMEKELEPAMTKNDQIVKAVFAIARKYQIPPTQLQTDWINVSQRFSDERVTRQPPVFLGYTVTKNVAIILRDVSKTEDLLADIIKSGVSEVQNVSFQTTQLRKHKDEARARAMKAAQEKATAMAKEIGQTIGKAYSIKEDGPTYNFSYAQNSNSNFRADSGEASANDENTIALGQISITARVTVSFELK
jgi:uncharacterized protein YggE